jgi:hypothetical protein
MNETVVELQIRSHLRTPEEITDILGVACDRFWHVGDFRAKVTRLKEKTHGWILSSGLPRSAPLEQQVSALIGRCAPAADKLRMLAAQDDVLFACVLYTTSIPALYFDAAVVCEISSFGAGLDIDVYLLDEADS